MANLTSFGSSPSSAVTQARILVVDDPRIASSVRRALVYEGYTVDLAEDGPTAHAARVRFGPICSCSTSCFPDSMEWMFAAISGAKLMS